MSWAKKPPLKKGKSDEKGVKSREVVKGEREEWKSERRAQRVRERQEQQSSKSQKKIFDRRVEGAKVYQLLVSSEQQLLTAHPHPGSCFIPKDQRVPADAKNANNPGLWRRKDCSEITVVVHQQIFLLLDKKYFFVQ